ncbi:hypothetical protein MTX26_01705 [Bradyrhizobium sp. ISRA443]|uniref:hypothetical protein n=1 Tax=unclassified Bradyrhizobium TaxID=2631580 RepID=UPI00247A03D5|nr:MULTISPECIES: hypothetical protein [unclassified Bradyrhizobium]WGR94785.1 hypothetical protein MTX20_11745 [Bradyrhizobium sp. ISRA435]WGR99614.1 hypothetical protein MTX23_01705 [Bradyrhizobium sp. ISRA436]WGS06504.1 hypothetical protein MTX18_01705 [Bradyrhizobium sp. ISRA437]WGS13388.1 hypothetical protein MTX26_01705 [Bradyrhizobium sp. ISRA443]
MIDWDALNQPVGNIDDAPSEEQTTGLPVERPWSPAEAEIAAKLFHSDDAFCRLPPVFTHEGENGEEIFANAEEFKALMGLDRLPTEEEALAFSSRVLALWTKLLDQRAAELDR